MAKLLCYLLYSGTSLVVLTFTCSAGICPTNDATSRPMYLVIDVSRGSDADTYPTIYMTNNYKLTEEDKTQRIVLRYIPAGEFTMGSPTSEVGSSLLRLHPDEQQHKVRLTKGFYIGIYEVTQGQYSNVTGIAYRKRIATNAPNAAIASVTWNAARGGVWPGGLPDRNSFVGKLRTRTGLPVDLPTEAQWEYACRAGSTNAFNNNMELVSAWVSPCEYSASTDVRLTKEVGVGNRLVLVGIVGMYQPNAWGLYDMHGNVIEWCLDWYGRYHGDETDPVGAPQGTERVVRGGGSIFLSCPIRCRSAARENLEPSWNEGTGLRLCVTL